MALVMSRNEGERIMIGDDIVITLTKCRGHQAVIAVDAPKHIPVHREEIYNAIKNEQPTGLNRS